MAKNKKQKKIGGIKKDTTGKTGNPVKPPTQQNKSKSIRRDSK